MTSSSSDAGGSSAQASLAWLDRVKTIGLLWIFGNHAVERVFGYPLIANPFAGWPPLNERIAQLAPLTGHGLWTVPVNIVRYTGWFGDVGVQLFLVVSGFGLTWSLLRKQGLAPIAVGSFYRRRAERIYPLWWGVHLAFAATWMLVGWGLEITSPMFYLSMAGIRITPELLYYFSPAWWYVGLLVQLYLVYPLLWEGLRRRGPGWLLVAGCLIGFIARAAGLMFFDEYLDAWQRGAVFVTRLPEFVLGMSLAAAFRLDPDRTKQLLRSPTMVLTGIVGCVVGTGLSLTLIGMAVAPFLLGAGVLVFLFAWLGEKSARNNSSTGPIIWVGRHSYSLYLIHHPMILVLLPEGLGPTRAVAGTAVAAILTLILAVTLERGVALSRSALATILERRDGLWSLAWRGVIVVGLLPTLLLGGELTVRRLAPQEVMGWGERPSVEPDDRFGWRLKASQTTRLRWESYDYQVTANSLGFPGPEPRKTTPSTVRILTTGDAFTSAEGVDTNQAWPRQLEETLARSRSPGDIEVINFGITGYGPTQYAAVLETFVPRLQPEVIVVGMYLNDYQDVLISDDDFRSSIGFGRASPEDWSAIARLEHLRVYARLRIVEPLKAWLKGEPDPRGYFLGGFGPLERRTEEEWEAARREVDDRLSRIARVTRDAGAHVIVMVIPSPAEVCGPEDLHYYPSHVPVTDRNRFDPDKPRRATKQMAGKHGFSYIDLLPVLKSSRAGCPYQPDNLHWLAPGHELVATYLADWLTDSGYLTRGN